MADISSIIFYMAVFMSIYVQVFFLVTFFENRNKVAIRRGYTALKSYPGVTIIVPCWNEENTVEKTVNSLLDLNYPKDKLKVFLINDGSVDGTWEKLKKFASHKNVKIFHKKNGGKHTALNLGLEHAKTDFVGCLDADSFVDREALCRIMSYFEQDPLTMAVAPSVVVDNPKGILQNAQRVEYNMGIFFKKMLAFLGAINVTPGPFTIFRKKVFDDLGPYKKAHNTEDMEIAYRMQKNHYKIEHCNDAYIYTNTPFTIPKLFKQRLRWIYGFINNTIDYRGVLLNKKYGNFSLFTLPTGIIAVFAVSYVFGRTVYNVGHFIFSKAMVMDAAGFSAVDAIRHYDLFFLNIKPSLFVTLSAYSLVILSIILGRKMTEGTKEKWGFPYQIIYYFIVFSFIAPFWIMKAIYNTIVSRAPAWR